MSRILIAEDAALFRQIVRTVLSFVGHELFEAESGPQALRLAKEVVPDLVLMDVHMPGEFDGIETCRRMRGATALRHVPIVMLTAFDDPMMRSRAEDAGADLGGAGDIDAVAGCRCPDLEVELSGAGGHGGDVEVAGEGEGAFAEVAGGEAARRLDGEGFAGRELDRTDAGEGAEAAGGEE